MATTLPTLLNIGFSFKESKYVTREATRMRLLLSTQAEMALNLYSGASLFMFTDASQISCDAAETGPPCNWYQHHKLNCTFERPSRKDTTSRSKRKCKETLEIAKRLELVEAKLIRVRELHNGDLDSGTSDAIDAPSITPQFSRIPILILPPTIDSQSASLASCYLQADEATDPAGHFYFFSHDFGTLCSPTGLPQFTDRCKRWIHAVTGEWPDFKESGDWEPVIPSAAPRLNGGLTEAQHSARACVFAFCAITADKFRDARVSKQLDVEACVRQAEHLLISVSGDASLTTLQASLMMMVWKAKVGSVSGIGIYHAIACRIVFALGGHTRVSAMRRNREPTIQERHDHHVRSMFWLCYIFDKELALRSGQPPIVGDEYCDLTLPEGYHEHVYRTRQSTYEPDELPIPWLISDLRLVQIKSRAAKELFSVAASKKSDAELLLTIRELDEELERWRLSIPTEYAPNLAIRKGAKLIEHVAQSENMLQIELHLAYHHLLSIIHRASARCAGNQSRETSETSSGLQSSVDLSVEASRSTLIFLSLAAHRLDGEAFRIFYFYPLSAFISLFFNLLRSPCNEYADLDLELIRTASDIIKKMPKSKSTADEATYLGRIDRFRAEVARLAERAVERFRGG
ncbi:Transcription factor [Akanthomyces lecanii RCEF 1005]|uniref:Transcription factor n=1 Tax=Akanthomyces lecanii RCEF 1005 TaxID=1081108 RepID=A0A162K2T7_CORDF|nr:Transcription factor [Akanthomyces lecanii RCEF 1005]